MIPVLRPSDRDRGGSTSPNPMAKGPRRHEMALRYPRTRNSVEYLAVNHDIRLWSKKDLHELMRTISVFDNLTICKLKGRNSNNYQFLVKFVSDILEDEKLIMKQWQGLLYLPGLYKCMTSKRVEQVLETRQLGQGELSRVSMVGMCGIEKIIPEEVLVEIGPQFDFSALWRT